jgi:hypothetical protein
MEYLNEILLGAIVVSLFALYIKLDDSLSKIGTTLMEIKDNLDPGSRLDEEPPIQPYSAN